MNPSATIYDRGLSTVGYAVLDEMIAKSYVLVDDWKELSPVAQRQILRSKDREAVLDLLVEHNLLTAYQSSRIEAGRTFGLVLGNYRVLERLGAGGMAVVFKAEHLEMRNLVAVKVLPMSLGQDERLHSRFTAEMRTVARLRHPNIVAAVDAGHICSDDRDKPVLWYLVMEYVPGQDLEEYALRQGPLPVQKACNIIYQVAGALDEIHKYRLVHRDIKPSNIMVTAEDQAKLLDFGLSRQLDAHANTRVTQPGTLLGTVDFMAPEQARDASTVDIRADIYSLGVTLFWCLTGQFPFPTQVAALHAPQPRHLPSVAQLVPGVAPELDAVLARMTAFDPADRYGDPGTVLTALLPFLKPETRPLFPARPLPELDALAAAAAAHEGPATTRSVLVVDDDQGLRDYCQLVLGGEGLCCDVVADGASCLAALDSKKYDLVLMDVCLPDIAGPKLLQKLRAAPPVPHLKVIMFSGMATPEEMAQMLSAGADDFLVKPLCVTSFKGRVRAALRLKAAQDSSALLNCRLLAANADLERSVGAREEDLTKARHALVQALARLLELRDPQAGARLQRLRRFSRCLAREVGRDPAYAGQLDPRTVDILESCAALYDIGKVVLPDHILLNPGKLTDEERTIMQTHATVGADTLKEIAQQHSHALAFLHLAAEVARSHHERWDGNGYPDGLAGEAIPLAARLIAFCDVYDALRSRRLHKPALGHAPALTVMKELCTGQFDPSLLPAFLRCAAEFARIFDEIPEKR